MDSMQTSPRCQISSASFAISLTFAGKRLCVSARTKIRNVPFNFTGVVTVGKECFTQCYAPRVPAACLDARVDLRDGECYVASPSLPSLGTTQILVLFH